MLEYLLNNPVAMLLAMIALMMVISQLFCKEGN